MNRDYLRRFTNAVGATAQIAHLHALTHQIINQLETVEVRMSALTDAVAQNTQDIQALIGAAENLVQRYAGDPAAKEVNDAIAALKASHDAVAGEVSKLDADGPAADATPAPTDAPAAPAADASTPSDPATPAV